MAAFEMKSRNLWHFLSSSPLLCHIHISYLFKLHLLVPCSVSVHAAGPGGFVQIGLQLGNIHVFWMFQSTRTEVLTSASWAHGSFKAASNACIYSIKSLNSSLCCWNPFKFPSQYNFMEPECWPKLPERNQWEPPRSRKMIRNLSLINIHH